MKEKVLIVEDEFIEANNLMLMLGRAGYGVCGIAASVAAAKKIIDQEQPTLVLLDIFLDGPRTGIDLGQYLLQKGIAFVYLSANSSEDILQEVKKTRPYGFLVKPFRERDVLVMLEIAQYLHQIDRENQKSHQPLVHGQDKNVPVPYRDFGIVHNSLQMKEMLDNVGVVACADTTVLILGESGTGKERIAELVHGISKRKAKPFIKVNCAALPSTLIESELFGYEKGAFTGAMERRIGKFELADGGTIFLDEIGELPLDVQSKFLRVLQEREFERIGGNNVIKSNVRIIAATNRNLEHEVANGKFRMDLYFRLNIFPIVIPPLRERLSDIPDLAHSFTQHFSQAHSKTITGIASNVMKLLMTHTWPGNVRELEHVIERSVLLSKDNIISLIPEFSNIGHATLLTASTRNATLKEVERDHIVHVLEICNGKIYGTGGAAEILGMKVSTLNAKIRKLGITGYKKLPD